jgi:hypothetical protein
MFGVVPWFDGIAIHRTSLESVALASPLADNLEAHVHESPLLGPECNVEFTRITTLLAGMTCVLLVTSAASVKKTVAFSPCFTSRLPDAALVVGVRATAARCAHGVFRSPVRHLGSFTGWALSAQP